MYQVDELDCVFDLDNVPESCAGAPLPLVFADESCLLLCYRVAKSFLEKYRPQTTDDVARVDKDDVHAIVRFKKAYAHFLGPPNDEALHGHPLYRRGLEHYGAFEIAHSSWIRAMERMNSVHRHHERERFMQGKRHFIFAFHDSTFECVAHDFEVEIVEGSITATFERIWR